MKAEDIVIKLNRGGILSDIEVECYNNGAKAQAEVSFKAGIKEVVEWIEKHHWEESSVPGYIDYGFNEIPWKAQKKEWGL